MSGMDEYRDANGDYTEAGLRYPGMKADLTLCYKYLSELCNIVWAGGPYNPKMSMWSIPPRLENFDMQLSAAFDELTALRTENAELREAQRWILVGERLPTQKDADRWGYVRGIDSEKSQFFFRWYEIPEWNESAKITHWMPLPEPPKEDE